MSNDEAMEWLTSDGGAPSVSFLNLGDEIIGQVLKLEMVQQREFGTKKLLYWDDGNPRMQACITLRAEQFTAKDEDDDGTRRLFVKGQMREALKEAISKSGQRGDITGGRLWVKFVGHGESKSNPANPPKKYQAKYAPPSAEQVLDQAEGPEPESYSEEPF